MKALQCKASHHTQREKAIRECAQNEQLVRDALAQVQNLCMRHASIGDVRTNFRSHPVLAANAANERSLRFSFPGIAGCNKHIQVHVERDSFRLLLKRKH